MIERNKNLIADVTISTTIKLIKLLITNDIDKISVVTDEESTIVVVQEKMPSETDMSKLENVKVTQYFN
ncbi:hypothetical protein D0U04_19505 [Bacillus clarus]|uniref:Uncharacterized protein n=1 Tax=Bacillus clarus TaxID=2338372 RepID=A0A090Z1G7_9BACI|nr:hypothetical protein [Bacillus clarus]KFN04208.1 hypothetical protein DJ93_4263 [Bacillus clarus]RFT65436.1 hypothetical protein D0U04_19505 [Bacillus clarus]